MNKVGVQYGGGISDALATYEQTRINENKAESIRRRREALEAKRAKEDAKVEYDAQQNTEKKAIKVEEEKQKAESASGQKEDDKNSIIPTVTKDKLSKNEINNNGVNGILGVNETNRKAAYNRYVAALNRYNEITGNISKRSEDDNILESIYHSNPFYLGDQAQEIKNAESDLEKASTDYMNIVGSNGTLDFANGVQKAASKTANSIKSLKAKVEVDPDNADKYNAEIAKKRKQLSNYNEQIKILNTARKTGETISEKKKRIETQTSDEYVSNWTKNVNNAKKNYTIASSNYSDIAQSLGGDESAKELSNGIKELKQTIKYFDDQIRNNKELSNEEILNFDNQKNQAIDNLKQIYSRFGDDIEQKIDSASANKSNSIKQLNNVLDQMPEDSYLELRARKIMGVPYKDLSDKEKKTIQKSDATSATRDVNTQAADASGMAIGDHSYNIGRYLSESDDDVSKIVRFGKSMYANSDLAKMTLDKKKKQLQDNEAKLNEKRLDLYSKEYGIPKENLSSADKFKAVHYDWESNDPETQKELDATYSATNAIQDATLEINHSLNKLNSSNSGGAFMKGTIEGFRDGHAFQTMDIMGLRNWWDEADGDRIMKKIESGKKLTPTEATAIKAMQESQEIVSILGAASADVKNENANAKIGTTEADIKMELAGSSTPSKMGSSTVDNLQFVIPIGAWSYGLGSIGRLGIAMRGISKTGKLYSSLRGAGKAIEVASNIARGSVRESKELVKAGSGFKATWKGAKNLKDLNMFEYTKGLAGKSLESAKVSKFISKPLKNAAAATAAIADAAAIGVMQTNVIGNGMYHESFNNYKTGILYKTIENEYGVGRMYMKDSNGNLIDTDEKASDYAKFGTYGEYGSEMVGPVFDAALAMLGRRMPGWSAFSRTALARSIGTVADLSGGSVSSILSEHLEEVSNNIYGAAISLNNWEDVVDPEQNLNTFLYLISGIAPQHMVTAGVSTVAQRAEIMSKSRKSRKESMEVLRSEFCKNFIEKNHLEGDNGIKLANKAFNKRLKDVDKIIDNMDISSINSSEGVDVKDSNGNSLTSGTSDGLSMEFESALNLSEKAGASSNLGILRAFGLARNKKEAEDGSLEYNETLISALNGYAAVRAITNASTTSLVSAIIKNASATKGSLQSQINALGGYIVKDNADSNNGTISFTDESGERIDTGIRVELNNESGKMELANKEDESLLNDYTSVSRSVENSGKVKPGTPDAAKKAMSSAYVSKMRQNSLIYVTAARTGRLNDIKRKLSEKKTDLEHTKSYVKLHNILSKDKKSYESVNTKDDLGENISRDVYSDDMKEYSVLSSESDYIGYIGDISKFDRPMYNKYFDKLGIKSDAAKDAFMANVYTNARLSKKAKTTMASSSEGILNSISDNNETSSIAISAFLNDIGVDLEKAKTNLSDKDIEKIGKDILISSAILNELNSNDAIGGSSDVSLDIKNELKSKLKNNIKEKIESIHQGDSKGIIEAVYNKKMHFTDDQKELECKSCASNYIKAYLDNSVIDGSYNSADVDRNLLKLGFVSNRSLFGRTSINRDDLSKEVLSVSDIMGFSYSDDDKENENAYNKSIDILSKLSDISSSKNKYDEESLIKALMDSIGKDSDMGKVLSQRIKDNNKLAGYIYKLANTVSGKYGRDNNGRLYANDSMYDKETSALLRKALSNQSAFLTNILHQDFEPDNDAEADVVSIEDESDNVADKNNEPVSNDTDNNSEEDTIDDQTQDVIEDDKTGESETEDSESKKELNADKAKLITDTVVSVISANLSKNEDIPFSDVVLSSIPDIIKALYSDVDNLISETSELMDGSINAIVLHDTVNEIFNIINSNPKLAPIIDKQMNDSSFNDLKDKTMSEFANVFISNETFPLLSNADIETLKNAFNDLNQSINESKNGNGMKLGSGFVSQMVYSTDVNSDGPYDFSAIDDLIDKMSADNTKSCEGLVYSCFTTIDKNGKRIELTYGELTNYIDKWERNYSTIESRLNELSQCESAEEAVASIMSICEENSIFGDNIPDISFFNNNLVNSKKGNKLLGIMFRPDMLGNGGSIDKFTGVADIVDFVKTKNEIIKGIKASLSNNKKTDESNIVHFDPSITIRNSIIYDSNEDGTKKYVKTCDKNCAINYKTTGSEEDNKKNTYSTSAENGFIRGKNSNGESIIIEGTPNEHNLVRTVRNEYGNMSVVYFRGSNIAKATGISKSNKEKSAEKIIGFCKFINANSSHIQFMGEGRNSSNDSEMIMFKNGENGNYDKITVNVGSIDKGKTGFMSYLNRFIYMNNNKDNIDITNSYFEKNDNGDIILVRSYRNKDENGNIDFDADPSTIKMNITQLSSGDVTDEILNNAIDYFSNCTFNAKLTNYKDSILNAISASGNSKDSKKKLAGSILLPGIVDIEVDSKNCDKLIGDVLESDKNGLYESSAIIGERNGKKVITRGSYLYLNTSLESAGIFGITIGKIAVKKHKLRSSVAQDNKLLSINKSQSDTINTLNGIDDASYEGNSYGATSVLSGDSTSNASLNGSDAKFASVVGNIIDEMCRQYCISIGKGDGGLSIGGGLYTESKTSTSLNEQSVQSIYNTIVGILNNSQIVGDYIELNISDINSIFSNRDSMSSNLVNIALKNVLYRSYDNNDYISNGKIKNDKDVVSKLTATIKSEIESYISNIHSSMSSLGIKDTDVVKVVGNSKSDQNTKSSTKETNYYDGVKAKIRISKENGFSRSDGKAIEDNTGFIQGELDISIIHNDGSETIVDVKAIGDNLSGDDYGIKNSCSAGGKYSQQLNLYSACHKTQSGINVAGMKVMCVPYLISNNTKGDINKLSFSITLPKTATYDIQKEPVVSLNINNVDYNLSTDTTVPATKNAPQEERARNVFDDEYGSEYRVDQSIDIDNCDIEKAIIENNRAASYRTIGRLVDESYLSRSGDGSVSISIDNALRLVSASNRIKGALFKRISELAIRNGLKKIDIVQSSSAGRTEYSIKNGVVTGLTLSVSSDLLSNEEELSDTILHELIHCALAGIDKNPKSVAALKLYNDFIEYTKTDKSHNAVVSRSIVTDFEEFLAESGSNDTMSGFIKYEREKSRLFKNGILAKAFNGVLDLIRDVLSIFGFNTISVNSAKRVCFNEIMKYINSVDNTDAVDTSSHDISKYRSNTYNSSTLSDYEESLSNIGDQFAFSDKNIYANKTIASIISSSRNSLDDLSKLANDAISFIDMCKKNNFSIDDMLKNKDKNLGRINWFINGLFNAVVSSCVDDSKLEKDGSESKRRSDIIKSSDYNLLKEIHDEYEKNTSAFKFFIITELLSNSNSDISNKVKSEMMYMLNALSKSTSDSVAIGIASGNFDGIISSNSDIITNSDTEALGSNNLLVCSNAISKSVSKNNGTISSFRHIKTVADLNSIAYNFAQYYLSLIGKSNSVLDKDNIVINKGIAVSIINNEIKTLLNKILLSGDSYDKLSTEITRYENLQDIKADIVIGNSLFMKCIKNANAMYSGSYVDQDGRIVDSGSGDIGDAEILDSTEPFSEESFQYRDPMSFSQLQTMSKRVRILLSTIPVYIFNNKGECVGFDVDKSTGLPAYYDVVSATTTLQEELGCASSLNDIINICKKSNNYILKSLLFEINKTLGIDNLVNGDSKILNGDSYSLSDLRLLCTFLNKSNYDSESVVYRDASHFTVFSASDFSKYKAELYIASSGAESYVLNILNGVKYNGDNECTKIIKNNLIDLYNKANTSGSTKSITDILNSIGFTVTESEIKLLGKTNNLAFKNLAKSAIARLYMIADVNNKLHNNAVGNNVIEDELSFSGAYTSERWYKIEFLKNLGEPIEMISVVPNKTGDTDKASIVSVDPSTSHKIIRKNVSYIYKGLSNGIEEYINKRNSTSQKTTKNSKGGVVYLSNQKNMLSSLFDKIKLSSSGSEYSNKALRDKVILSNSVSAYPGSTNETSSRVANHILSNNNISGYSITYGNVNDNKSRKSNSSPNDYSDRSINDNLVSKIYRLTKGEIYTPTMANNGTELILSSKESSDISTSSREAWIKSLFYANGSLTDNGKKEMSLRARLESKHAIEAISLLEAFVLNGDNFSKNDINRLKKQYHFKGRLDIENRLNNKVGNGVLLSRFGCIYFNTKSNDKVIKLELNLNKEIERLCSMAFESKDVNKCIEYLDKAKCLISYADNLFYNAGLKNNGKNSADAEYSFDKSQYGDVVSDDMVTSLAGCVKVLNNNGGYKNDSGINKETLVASFISESIYGNPVDKTGGFGNKDKPLPKCVSSLFDKFINAMKIEEIANLERSGILKYSDGFMETKAMFPDIEAVSTISIDDELYDTIDTSYSYDEYIKAVCIMHLMAITDFENLYGTTLANFKDLTDQTKRYQSAMSTGTEPSVMDIDAVSNNTIKKSIKNGKDENGNSVVIEDSKAKDESVLIDEAKKISKKSVFKYVSIKDVSVAENLDTANNVTVTGADGSLTKRTADSLFEESADIIFADVKDEKKKKLLKDQYKSNLDSIRGATPNDKPIASMDGACFMTIEAYREYLIKEGRLDIRVYDGLMEHLKNGDQLTNEEMFMYERIHMAPMKLVYDACGSLSSDEEFDKNPNDTESHNEVLKMAVFPLMPSICRKGSFGAELLRILKETGADMIGDSEIEKVGSSYEHSAASEIDGNITGSNLRKESVYTRDINIQFLRRQLETDHDKEDSMRKLGSQVLAVILGNISNGKKITIRKGGSSTTVDGHKIAVNAMTKMGMLAEVAEAELIDKWFDVGGDGVLYISKDKLLKLIKTQVITKELSDIISINSDKLPVSMLISNSLFESSIMSEIRDSIESIHTRGNTYIQQPSTIIRSMVDASEEDKSKLLNKGRRLQLINDDNSMDCVISINAYNDILSNVDWVKFRSDNNLDTSELVSSGRIKYTFDEARMFLMNSDIIGYNAKPHSIGYRVPTQSKSSILALKVVDVVDASSNNIIMLPDGYIAITGSDFDVDKLYVAQKYYEVDKDNNVSVLGSRVSDIVSNGGDLESIKSLKHAKEEIASSLIDDYINIMIAEESFIETHTPIDSGTKLFKGDGKHPGLIERLHVSFNGFGDMYKNTLSFQLNKKLENAGSTEGIGPFALLTVNHVYAQISELSLTKRGSDIFGTNSLHDELSRDKRLITDWASYEINAHVDAVKDPYILLFNVNNYTWSAVTAMLRAGFGQQSLFITSQPIIRDVANEYSSSKSCFSKDNNKTSGVRFRDGLSGVISKYVEKIRTSGVNSFSINGIETILSYNGEQNPKDKLYIYFDSTRKYDDKKSAEYMMAKSHSLFIKTRNSYIFNTKLFSSDEDGGDRNLSILYSLFLHNTNPGFNDDGNFFNDQINILERMVNTNYTHSQSERDINEFNFGQLILLYCFNSVSNVGKQIDGIVSACQIDQGKTGSTAQRVSSFGARAYVSVNNCTLSTNQDAYIENACDMFTKTHFGKKFRVFSNLTNSLIGGLSLPSNKESLDKIFLMKNALGFSNIRDDNYDSLISSIQETDILKCAFDRYLYEHEFSIKTRNGVNSVILSPMNLLSADSEYNAINEWNDLVMDIREELFIYNKSISEKVALDRELKYKSLFNGDNKELIKTLGFIRSSNIRTSDGGVLTVPSKIKISFDKNKQQSAFEAMVLNLAENKNSRDVMIRLLLASFYSGGTIDSSGNLFKSIRHIVGPYIKYNNDPISNEEVSIDSIQRDLLNNSAYDSKLSSVYKTISTYAASGNYSKSFIRIKPDGINYKSDISFPSLKTIKSKDGNIVKLDVSSSPIIITQDNSLYGSDFIAIKTGSGKKVYQKIATLNDSSSSKESIDIPYITKTISEDGNYEEHVSSNNKIAYIYVEIPQSSLTNGKNNSFDCLDDSLHYEYSAYNNMISAIDSDENNSELFESFAKEYVAIVMGEALSKNEMSLDDIKESTNADTDKVAYSVGDGSAKSLKLIIPGSNNNASLNLIDVLNNASFIDFNNRKKERPDFNKYLMNIDPSSYIKTELNSILLYSKQAENKHVDKLIYGCFNMINETLTNSSGSIDDSDIKSMKIILNDILKNTNKSKVGVYNASSNLLTRFDEYKNFSSKSEVMNPVKSKSLIESYQSEDLSNAKSIMDAIKSTENIPESISNEMVKNAESIVTNSVAGNLLNPIPGNVDGASKEDVDNAKDKCQ